MVQNSLERFNKIIKVTRFMAALCGADVANPNYKMGPITWAVIVAINAFFCCTIYTIYMGVFVDGDWKVLLQSLCLVGSAVQGYAKLLLCIYRRLVMISLTQKLEYIYEHYQYDKNYQEILRYRTDLTTKMLKIFMYIYIGTVCILVMYPLSYGYWNGEKLFVMQFLLPGIDPTTEIGYLIHNIFQSFLVTLGGFGNFAGDMYIFIFITHIPLLKDILRVKCRELNTVALKTHDLKETMPLLKDILECHKNYDIFVQQIEEVYYGVIFVQILTSVVSICCTLFSIVIGGWPAAFAYLFYSSVIFYSYCGLGHLVEISNDEVVDVIYADLSWYELSVVEQKLIILMILKSQKPINLTVGQIMSLSMSTALQLTKAIYSYMMMLLNFLETDEM